MPQPPQSYRELETLITAEYATLSKRLQQTARFVLDHPQEVALATVAKIAEQADVTPSTLIRLANSLGFKGFSEMQQLFRSRLVDELPNYTERIRAVRSATGETPDSTQLLWEFADANRAVLEQLPSRIDPESLEKALDIFEKAHAIHVMGARRSFMVASYMTYALAHVDKPALLVNGLGGMYGEQLRAMSQHDALLTISFSPYAEESQKACEDAHQRGLPIVVITDSNLSPLARFADVVFVVNEAEVKSFRSLTASLCLTQTLAIALGVRQDKTRDKEKGRDKQHKA
ncbi:MULTISPECIES: MurR/RpiR family transcriptional regulator [Halomonadaceae]|jgi:DNA-binding MurR/RpiR family transcriptional regulator|uniref:MurR/RpiR family transcriptional regulator n=1 Tax=Halomonadaceae TaxID=28256 RepID=UPI0012F37392|nr:MULTISPECIES: MurR/RpiR family transcriptional regulator [Halomonas]CAD5259903.1 Fe-S cluster assembly protein HesB [Halomonas sp. 59]CAD5260183.1 Fe-S cluster assembly protein HesB [Halomonas sp. 113]CAD5274181.1 Predicted transcriptional regulator of the myo-inositol catabolic operon [Halomonas sp. I3]CAD5288498.1 Fe-S cluster assembly protein HesB [Halomonas sp. 156]VXB37957.1 Fe-S cluster assembly protein HesB [Halomonas titanicae]